MTVRARCAHLILLTALVASSGCKDSNNSSSDAGTLPDGATQSDGGAQPDGAAQLDAGPQPDAGGTEIEQVCNRWTSDRQDLSEGSWSGDVAGCDAGDVTAAGRANALKQVNLYRWLADLPPSTTDSAKDANAQECALMMHAHGQLDHSPTSSWDCYSSAGAGAAGTSNLATSPGVAAVTQYMIDRGNATTIGHRRWILSNSLGAIGLGTTSSYSCMTVIGTGGSASAAWTAWPPPGIVPHAVMGGSWSSVDDTGWTVQSDSINLSGAQVTITSGGQDRPVDVIQLLSGYGSAHAIKITPSGWTSQTDTTYTVSVAGVSPPITYDVQFVSCN